MRNLRDSELDMSRLSLTGKITIYCFLSFLFLMFITAIILKNRGKCLYAVWHNISFLTLIHWIPLINIDNNSEFESFFSEIAVIFRPFSLPSICSDEPIETGVYKSLNIDSNGFINNAKEMLLIYFAVIIFCIMILIISRYKSSEIIEKIKKQVKYSVIIRLHLLLYLDFMTFSMINVYFYSGKNTCSTINLGFSLFFLIMGGCWILAIPVIIKVKMTRDRESHHDILFESIGTIVNEFKPCFQTLKYQFYTIFLLYRFSLSFCLVILPNSPSVQLFVIAVFQAIILFYICIANPFSQRRDSITVFITEFLCLFLVVIIGIRSLENLSDNIKFFTSTFCVIVIWLTEFTIVIRFVLRIYSANISSLETFANDTQNPVIVPVNNNNLEKQSSAGADKKSDLSIDKLAESIVKEKDEDEEAVETFAPFQAYKFIKPDNIENLNTTALENINDNSETKDVVTRLPVKLETRSFFESNTVSRLSTRNFSDLKPETKIFTEIKPESRAITGNTYNINDFTVAKRSSKPDNTQTTNFYINTSSQYGFKERLPNITEELRINNFLEKVNNTKLQVGNRGFTNNFSK